MQDETHPVFTSPSSITYYNCRSLSDVYLQTGELTLTHFIPAQYEKNVTVN